MRVSIISRADDALGSAGLRERKKQRTRQSIAEAAAQVFDEVGYEKARTAEIARRADVAEATLFRYFPTKADLAVEQVHWAIARMVSALSARPLQETPYAAVLAAATPETVLDLVSERPDRIFRLLKNEQVASRTLFAIFEACDQVAVDIARRLGTTTEDPHAKVMANACVGVVITSLQEWSQAPGSSDALAIFRRHLKVLRPVLDAENVSARGARGAAKRSIGAVAQPGVTRRSSEKKGFV